MNILKFVLLASVVAKSNQLTCQNDFRRPGMVCMFELFPELFMLHFIDLKGPKMSLLCQCLQFP